MAQNQPEAIARPARMSEPEVKNSNLKSQPAAARSSKAQAKPSGTSYLGLFVGVAVILAGYVYQMHVKPTLTLLGSNETIGNLNNQDCHLIKELTGCEDQWIDRASGLSHLACTPTSPLKHDFFPPLHHLNTSRIPLPWTRDTFGSYIALFDTASEKITKLRLEGLPDDSLGLQILHSLDLVLDRSVDPPRATVFVVNHKPPMSAVQGNVNAAKAGADSVVEIFETELGGDVLTWKRTFSHPNIKTPNNIVAIDAEHFYISNDHADKTSFARRNFNTALLPTSDIQFCQVDRDNCYTAAEGLQYPNGIAKGPGRSLYVASSSRGEVYMYHQDPDHRLVKQDTINLGKVPDNLHVTEEGDIYAAIITKVKNFGLAAHSDHLRRTVEQPVQVIRISNQSAVLQYTAGVHYHKDTVFLDPGKDSGLQTATNAQYYKEKLYLTSCFSDALAICNVGPL